LRLTAEGIEVQRKVGHDKVAGTQRREGGEKPEIAGGVDGIREGGKGKGYRKSQDRVERKGTGGQEAE